MTTRPIVIVGGSLGGLRAAEQVRIAGWDGDIVIIGSERWLPYNRPPLSKELLAHAASDIDDLHSEIAFKQRDNLAATWRLGVTVTAADLEAHTVTTSDGQTIAYAGLVVASGLEPIRLRSNSSGDVARRFALRTLDDCVALREALHPESRVVIVGGGFIGCEVGASLSELGHDVSIIEGELAPYERVVGLSCANHLRDALTARANGRLQFIPNTMVASLSAAKTVNSDTIRQRTTLEDGRVIESDMIIEAIGARPNTQWLAGNRAIDISNGVLCDENLAVVGCEHAVAVGDVARYPGLNGNGTARRFEHWAAVSDTARIAAHTLLRSIGVNHEDGAKPKRTTSSIIPSFWSDVFGIRIQGVGHYDPQCDVDIVQGQLDDPLAGLAMEFRLEGNLIGATLVGLPANKLLQYRVELARK